MGSSSASEAFEEAAANESSDHLDSDGERQVYVKDNKKSVTTSGTRSTKRNISGGAGASTDGQNLRGNDGGGGSGGGGGHRTQRRLTYDELEKDRRHRMRRQEGAATDKRQRSDDNASLGEGDSEIGGDTMRTTAASSGVRSVRLNKKTPSSSARSTTAEAQSRRGSASDVTMTAHAHNKKFTPLQLMKEKASLVEQNKVANDKISGSKGVIPKLVATRVKETPAHTKQLGADTKDFEDRLRKVSFALNELKNITDSVSAPDFQKHRAVVQDVIRKMDEHTIEVEDHLAAANFLFGIDKKYTRKDQQNYRYKKDMAITNLTNGGYDKSQEVLGR